LVQASAAERCFAMSMPSTWIEPELGSRMLRIILMVVVFPAPLGPKSPTISLACTSKEIASTAVISPYCLLRFVTQSTFSDIQNPRL